MTPIAAAKLTACRSAHRPRRVILSDGQSAGYVKRITSFEANRCRFAIAAAYRARRAARARASRHNPSQFLYCKGISEGRCGSACRQQLYFDALSTEPKIKIHYGRFLFATKWAKLFIQ